MAQAEKAAPLKSPLYIQDINPTTQKWKIFQNYFSPKISNLQRIVIQNPLDSHFRRVFACILTFCHPELQLLAAKDPCILSQKVPHDVRGSTAPSNACTYS